MRICKNCQINIDGPRHKLYCSSNCASKYNYSTKISYRLYKKNWSRINNSSKSKKKYNFKIKKSNIDRLGGKCLNCGEEGYDFLNLDHINNDGYKDYKLKRFNNQYFAIKCLIMN